MTANGTSNTATANTGVTISGSNLTAAAFFESSDIRYKRVIDTNPKIDLSKIDVIKFVRTDDDPPSDKERFGYSAQQLFEILPEVVDKDEKGKLSVNYSDVHTLMIYALQERIEKLERELMRLRG